MKTIKIDGVEVRVVDDYDRIRKKNLEDALFGLLSLLSIIAGIALAVIENI